MTNWLKVDEQAVIKRVNRVLAKEDLIVRKNRSPGRWWEMGEYYVMLRSQNNVVSTNIDLEDWARESGVLAEYEAMALAE